MIRSIGVRDLTFDEVVRLLERSEDGQLIETAGKGIGMVSLIAGLGLGLPLPATLPITADVFTVSSLLTTSAMTVLKRLSKKTSPQERIEILRTAYGLLVCTAFFDAAEQLVPELLKATRYKESEREEILERLRVSIKSSEPEQVVEAPEIEFPFPRPTADQDQILAEQRTFYRNLVLGFKQYVKAFRVADSFPEQAAQEFENDLRNLAALALEKFQNHHLVLRMKSSDFNIWREQEEREETRKFFDTGMKRLAEVIAANYEQSERREGDDFITELRERYRGVLRRPILGEGAFDKSDRSSSRLRLPTKGQIYLPQQYQKLEYDHGFALGKPDTWKKQPTHGDLSDYLLRYLHWLPNDPNQLIILGSPGSGKSLMADILASQLSDSPFIPIKIKLRSVSAEKSIRQQVEEYFAQEFSSGRNWSIIRSQLNEQVTVLILDGYDELLQSSGELVTNYLLNVKEFLEDEREHGRHMKVIITSRPTLIDRANIPLGTSVITLNPFNNEQRAQWVSIWNRVNKTYFCKEDLDPFKLPVSNATISELAQQPLLLLMLALYDASSSNALQKQAVDLSLAYLYSNIVDHFIDRQNKKFSPGTPSDSKRKVDRDKVSICALGMFNRNKLTLSKDELERDLRLFTSELEATEEDSAIDHRSNDDQQLSKAELVLERFFFVYSSASQTGSVSTKWKEVTFEFLHTTFAEFFVADFLFDTLWNQIEPQVVLRKSSRARMRFHDKSKELTNEWFHHWIYTPLHLRPTVLEMLGKCSEAYFQNGYRYGPEPITQEDFLAELDSLVKSQLYEVLAGNHVPDVMLQTEGAMSPKPFLVYQATYTLNLILAITTLSGGEYSLDLSAISDQYQEVDPWDRLNYLWLNAFSLANLSSLAGRFKVGKISKKINIIQRQIPVTWLDSSEALLELGISSASALLSSNLDELKNRTKPVVDLAQGLLAEGRAHRRGDSWGKELHEILTMLGYIFSAKLDYPPTPYPEALKILKTSLQGWCSNFEGISSSVASDQSSNILIECPANLLRLIFSEVQKSKDATSAGLKSVTIDFETIPVERKGISETSSVTFAFEFLMKDGLGIKIRGSRERVLNAAVSAFNGSFFILGYENIKILNIILPIDERSDSELDGEKRRA